jgi:hypothetical protein
MSNANNAKRQFEDNFNRHQGDPEKYNLYKGLCNLAAALEDIELRLSSIEQKIQR